MWEIEQATIEAAKQIVATNEMNRHEDLKSVEGTIKTSRKASGDADAVTSTQSTRTQGESKSTNTVKNNANEADKRRKPSPWRDACDEVAKRYRLSKRETEIFHIISKGRNAEFVSNELYISVHTAKTHIANIYQKLDVHSSQEMLDLIDAFRRESEEKK